LQSYGGELGVYVNIQYIWIWIYINSAPLCSAATLENIKKGIQWRDKKKKKEAPAKGEAGRGESIYSAVHPPAAGASLHRMTVGRRGWIGVVHGLKAGNERTNE
jgi:hypothetical protein